jgi:MFS family permease
MNRFASRQGWESPTLKASIRDGLFYSLMIGAGETYLPAFGVFLLASSVQIGLLTTLPPVIGALFQYIGVRVLDNATHRRTIIARCAFYHALIWLPIAVIPFMFDRGSSAVWILIALVTAYHALLGMGVPLWNSLIGDLVPTTIRGEFFGYRNKVCGAATFAALAIAGVWLDVTKTAGSAALGYAALFLFSCWARLASAHWLTRYDDPAYTQPLEARFGLWRFLRQAPRSNFTRFTLIVGAMNCAVNFSGPYFSVYMLRDLGFSYSQFMAITAANIFAQFLTMHRWGSLSDTFGNKKILTVCAFGVACTQIVWLATTNFWIILAFHLYVGLVWAGFNLAAANFMFDAVSPPKRGRCSAYQAVINTIMILLGSLAGGYTATHYPSPTILNSWLGILESPYPVIFFISLILRLCIAALFIPMFKEVREVTRIGHGELIVRIVNIRPLTGATFGVITRALSKRA